VRDEITELIHLTILINPAVFQVAATFQFIDASFQPLDNGVTLLERFRGHLRRLVQQREHEGGGDLDLVFPNGDGKIEWHTNIIQRGLMPAQVAAGVTAPVLDANGKPKRDDEGKPVVTAKYTGASRTPAFLCVVVHQPKAGRRARAAGQSRAAPTRTFQHHGNAGHLWALVPAR